MAKCPNCKAESPNPAKTWKYGIFTVKAYICKNADTVQRILDRKGKHSFTLKLMKVKGYIKA